MTMNISTIKSIAAACCILMLAACKPPVEHYTPSGKPEVTILKTTKAKVKEELLNQMANMGYITTHTDDSMVVFDRPVDNPMAAAFFGSRYDSTPNTRLTYQIIQQEKWVRVIADFVIITNPGSGFERRTDMNRNEDSKHVQQLLNGIRDKLEARK
jgi:ABC-type oligopeptide transport system substrate-binding subunit